MPDKKRFLLDCVEKKIGEDTVLAGMAIAVTPRFRPQRPC